MKNIEASFSSLVISIGSAAAMAMGLTPHPETGKTEKNRDMAKFNIDLLNVIREKTKGNLNDEEKKLVDAILADLQLRFVDLK